MTRDGKGRFLNGVAVPVFGSSGDQEHGEVDLLCQK